jgi:hypothetical protein
MAEYPKLWAFIFLAIVAVAVLSGCIDKTPPDQTYELGNQVYGILERFTKLDVSFSHAPALNQTTEVTATLTAKRNLSNITTIKIFLPEDGFSVVDGNLSWSGIVKKNDTIRFSAVVKAIKTGDWEVWAEARGPRDINRGLSYPIFVSVREDSGTVSDMMPESLQNLPPIVVKFEISNAPTLNQVAEITATLALRRSEKRPEVKEAYASFPLYQTPYQTPHYKIAEPIEAIVKIHLPYTLALVGGNLSWRGIIPVDGEVKINATVRAVETGWGVIRVHVRHPSYAFLGGDKIILTIGENTSYISYPGYESRNFTVTRTPLPLHPDHPLLIGTK